MEILEFTFFIPIEMLIWEGGKFIFRADEPYKVRCRRRLVWIIHEVRSHPVSMDYSFRSLHTGA